MEPKIAPRLMIVTLLTLGSSSVAAAPLHDTRLLTLTFSNKVKARCTVGADHITARLKLTGVAPQQIKAMPMQHKVGPYRLWFKHDLGHVVRGVVERKTGLVRCTVARSGKRVRVLFGTVDRKEHLKDIHASLLEHLPMVLDTAARKDLEQVRLVISSGAYDTALRRLMEMRRQPHLRDYVTLRTADMHLLAGRLPTAFVKYKTLPESVGAQGMQLLARTRASELAYVVDNDPPDPVLLKALQRPTEPLGRVARRRLIKLMVLQGRIKDALLLSQLRRQKAAKLQSLQLLELLMRRHLQQGQAYEAALAYLRAEARGGMPESASLQRVLLLAGQAYLDLDLPADAAKLLHKCLAKVSAPAVKERLLMMLVNAYQRSNKLFRARQTVDFYIASFPRGPRFLAMMMVRVTLKLREGDLDGARKDLARLPAEVAKDQRQLLKLRLGQTTALATGDTTWTALTHLRSRQQQLGRVMDSKAAKEPRP